MLVGKSGVEIAWAVLEKRGIYMERMKPRYARNRSEEYWTGWALAWYQWERAVPFEVITGRVPIAEVKQMYVPYHELDIRQFVDKMDEKCRAAQNMTRLKQLRVQAGYTQLKLAELTEIPLRTLQQYEQRKKDINKARVDYVVRIAYVLGCRVQDLLEYFV
ncbi:MAG: helix-turn-helix domain-containing protein [Lachnospiraceae bacterium]|nr:helix-turn-helix domain-containing protein [Lachnospiraceae bacterium]